MFLKLKKYFLYAPRTQSCYFQGCSVYLPLSHCYLSSVLIKPQHNNKFTSCQKSLNMSSIGY